MVRRNTFVTHLLNYELSCAVVFVSEDSGALDHPFHEARYLVHANRTSPGQQVILRRIVSMKTLGVHLVASCLLLLAFTGLCEAVRCLACQDGADPRTCRTLTNCAQDEICYVEEVVTTSGQLSFHSGCMPQPQCVALGGLGSLPFGKRSSLGERSVDHSITTCLECCTGEVCNVQGCGKTVSPATDRAPYCFTCANSSESQSCQQVTQCPDGEICGLYTPRAYLGAAEVVFESTCMAKAMCSALHSAYSNARCVPTCCDTDYCNVGCNSSHSHLVTDAPITTVVPAGGCSVADGFTDYGHGLCLHMHEHRASWQQARDQCHAENAELVILDTREKSDALQLFTDTHERTHNFWIGGSDLYQNNTYYWVNGQQFRYAGWFVDPTGHNTQPNFLYNNKAQDCVAIWHDTPHQWHDEECDEELEYFCQRV